MNQLAILLKILITLWPLLMVFVATEGPICEVPCGPNADCKGDNFCDCRDGYTKTISEENGLPFCKASCDKPCNEYAACVAPNVCECVQGYEYDDTDDSCKPACSSKCPHGTCILPEVCHCNDGYRSVNATCSAVNANDSCDPDYIWDAELEICVERNDGQNGASVDTTTRGSTTPKLAVNVSVDVTTGKPDVVAPLVSTLKPSNSTRISHQHHSTSTANRIKTQNGNDHSSEYYTTEQSPPQHHDYNCPTGYVYFKGGCRPKIELQSEAPTKGGDCDLSLCGVANSYCINAERCACLPGFIWHNSVYKKAASCVSLEYLEEVKKRLDLNEDEDDSGWIYMLITALGIACITLAFMVLISVLYRYNRK